MGTKTQSPSPESKAIAKKLYAAFMAKHEPELLTDVIPTLDKKYEGETKGERADRTKRYQKAFDAFDAYMADFLEHVSTEVGSARKSALKEAEAKDRKDDLVKLEAMEASFQ